MPVHTPRLAVARPLRRWIKLYRQLRGDRIGRVQAGRPDNSLHGQRVPHSPPKPTRHTSADPPQRLTDTWRLSPKERAILTPDDTNRASARHAEGERRRKAEVDLRGTAGPVSCTAKWTTVSGTA